MWMFNDKPFAPDMIGTAAGMVYRITHKATERYYIGQKVFWSKRTLPPLKGESRKRKKLVPSDWQSYFGSSDELNALVGQEGEQAFTREILYLCQTKSQMNYLGTVLQMHHNVLFDPLSFNGIVNMRVSRKHLQNLNALIRSIASHYEGKTQ